MGLLKRFRHDEPPAETPCPRCGTPMPAATAECTACGWDTRESYHGSTEGKVVPPDAQPAADR